MSSRHVGLNRSRPKESRETALFAFPSVDGVVLSKEEWAVSRGLVATGNAGFFCPGTIMLRVGWFSLGTCWIWQMERLPGNSMPARHWVSETLQSLAPKTSAGDPDTVKPGSKMDPCHWCIVGYRERSGGDRVNWEYDIILWTCYILLLLLFNELRSVCVEECWCVTPELHPRCR